MIFGLCRARAQACAVSGKRSQTPLGGVTEQRVRWGRACSSLCLVLPFDAARVSVRVNAEGSRESRTRSIANPFGVEDTDVIDRCVHAMRECYRVRVRKRCKIYDMICVRWTRRYELVSCGGDDVDASGVPTNTLRGNTHTHIHTHTKANATQKNATKILPAASNQLRPRAMSAAYECLSLCLCLGHGGAVLTVLGRTMPPSSYQTGSCTHRQNVLRSSTSTRA